MPNKVLLMGKSRSGKTSMRSIIFDNCIARDTRKFCLTIDIERINLKFLGCLVLNLWDCGGQQPFMQSYCTRERDNIFKNVKLLIYVFDVESKDLKKDFKIYMKIVAALKEHSENARIICLIHKMDLVSEDDRDKVFVERVKKIHNITKQWEVAFFATSIWDDTLYKVWSNIAYQLIPNIEKLENRLSEFCNILEADEVILFERSTFLKIAYKSYQYDSDPHRFEKISNIVNLFKFSCRKVATNFFKMHIENNHFSAFIEEFTSNTYVMVIMRQPNICTPILTQLNIRNARKHFEFIEKIEQPQSSIAGKI